MTNYTKSTNFTSKDSLPAGSALKIVRGSEIDTEFTNIATSITTKTDNAAAAITGGTIVGITDLAVADGGTGSSTASGALVNLGAVAKAGDTMTGAFNEAPQVTIASASSVAIGAASANTINISGTTAITAFDTIAAGAVRRLVFAGALTLTHNATTLILPSGASITTAAGDVAEFVSLGSGNWRCFNYMKASGQAVVAPAAGVTSLTAGSGLTGGTITSTGTIALDVYNGSTVNYASYAVGSYVWVDSGALPDVNSTAAVWSAGTANTKVFFIGGGNPGSNALAGTWRCRGSAQSLGSGFLMTRTA
jgi:hypothetical protein